MKKRGKAMKKATVMGVLMTMVEAEGRRSTATQIRSVFLAQTSCTIHLLLTLQTPTLRILHYEQRLWHQTHSMIQMVQFRVMVVVVVAAAAAATAATAGHIC